MKKIIFSLMAILLAVGLVGAGAFAYFYDVEKSEDNVLQAGTVDILLGELVATGDITFDNMAPGDTATATITVTNDGSLELKYGMDTTFYADPDYGVIFGLFNVKITDADGVIIYDGYDSFAGFGLTGIAESARVTTDGRVLPPHESETLTFAITLPFDTDNKYQGVSSRVNFYFVAEQTANNP